jgi:hypothetical protein
MRLILGTLLVTAVAIAGACRSAQAPAPTSLYATPSTAVVFYDNVSGVRDSTRLVVRDQPGLERLWTRINQGRSEAAPAPTVDFRRDMVIAVGAGRMSPDDRIQVDSLGVRRETTAGGKVRDVLAVVVRTTEGCQRFRAEAYPVQVVQVRRFEGPVHFVERRAGAAGCRR